MFEPDTETTVLKTLTDTLADSVNGYRDAAEHVEDPQYKQLFTDLGAQREQALSTIRAAAGTAADDSDGSVLGSLHQRWLDVKAAITGRDDKAIINEVERGEDYLKEKFEAALKADDIEPQGRDAIQTAYRSVVEGHGRVRDLKHSLEGANL